MSLPSPILNFKPGDAVEASAGAMNVVRSFGQAATTFGAMNRSSAWLSGVSIAMQVLFQVFADQERMASDLKHDRVDAALTRDGVARLKAKLVAVKNSVKRLTDETLDAKLRREELPVAKRYCEEILALFDDDTYCLWTAVIPASEYLLAFSVIYVNVLAASTILDPTDNRHCRDQLVKVAQVLTKWKYRCIDDRLEKITFRTWFPFCSGFSRPVDEQVILDEVTGVEARRPWYKQTPILFPITIADEWPSNETICRRCSRNELNDCPHNVGKLVPLVMHFKDSGLQDRYIREYRGYREEVRNQYAAAFETALEAVAEATQIIRESTGTGTR